MEIPRVICKECGKEFTPKRWNQKYCTRLCNRRYWWRDYDTRHRASLRLQRKKEEQERFLHRQQKFIHSSHLQHMPTDRFAETINKILKGDTYYAGEK